MVTQLRTIMQIAADLRRGLTVATAPLRNSNNAIDRGVVSEADMVGYYLREAERHATIFLRNLEDQKQQPVSAPPPVVEQPGSPQ